MTVGTTHPPGAVFPHYCEAIKQLTEECRAQSRRDSIASLMGLGMPEAWAGVAARTLLLLYGDTVTPDGLDDLDHLSQAEPPQLGPEGRFLVDSYVGSGGFAIVMRGRDRKLGRSVALKIFTRPVHDREAYLREARALARISNAHVVQVYDVIEHDDTLILVLELLEGTTLSKYLKARHTTAEYVAVMSSVCDGVAAMHAKNLVHQDLSPANILCDANGNWKVADFGLAEDFWNITRIGGTAGFRAPEQVVPFPDRISARTDVWAIGVLLYRLLTGARPFADDASIVDGRYKPLTTLNVDPRLAEICHTCLQTDVQSRYESAAAVGAALRGWSDASRVTQSVGGTLVDLLWRAEHQPPDEIQSGPLMLPGVRPNPEDLSAGVFAPREQLYGTIYDQVIEWLAGTSAATTNALPVFWIAGPSGTGKSVALLHLMAALHRNNVGVLFWARSSLKRLGELVGYGAVMDDPRHPVIIGVDDPYQPSVGADQWLDILETPHGRPGSAVIVCCGPSDQLERFRRDTADFANVCTVEFDHVAPDYWELQDFYRARTGRQPLKGDRHDRRVLDLFFEWQNRDSLENYGVKLRRRIENADRAPVVGARLIDVLGRVLAINRLSLSYPTEAYRRALTGRDRDVLEAMLRDMTALPHAADSDGIRIAHAQLASALFDSWYPSQSSRHERAAIMVRAVEECLTHAATEQERGALLTTLAQVAASTRQPSYRDDDSRASTAMASELTAFVRSDDTQRIHALRVGHLSAPEISGWLAIQAQRDRPLDPDPMELLLAAIGNLGTSTNAVWLLSCLRSVAADQPSHPRWPELLDRLRDALASTTLMKVPGWSELAAFAMDQPSVRLTAAAISLSWLQEPRNQSAAAWPGLWLETYRHAHPNLRRRLRAQGLDWIRASVGHLLWPGVWQVIDKERSIDPEIRVSAVEWLGSEWASEAWAPTWLTLWKTRGEDQNAEAALRRLAIAWLDKFVCRATWVDVWHALHDAQTKDAAHLIDVASKWLGVAARQALDDASFGRLWQTVSASALRGAEAQASLDSHYLVALEWLSKCDPHTRWWAMLWSQMVLHPPARLGAVGLSIQARARANSSIWPQLWVDLFNLDSDVPELLQRARTWLPRSDSIQWDRVWRLFARQQPDEGLAIALAWLERQPPKIFAWWRVWADLWAFATGRGIPSSIQGLSVDNQWRVSVRKRLASVVARWFERDSNHVALVAAWTRVHRENDGLTTVLVGLELLRKLSWPRRTKAEIDATTEHRFEALESIVEREDNVSDELFGKISVTAQRILSTDPDHPAWPTIWRWLWKRERNPIGRGTLVGLGCWWLGSRHKVTASAARVWLLIRSSGWCVETVQNLWSAQFATQMVTTDAWAQCWLDVTVDFVARRRFQEQQTTLIDLVRSGYEWLAAMPSKGRRRTAFPSSTVWAVLNDICESGILNGADIPFSFADLSRLAHECQRRGVWRRNPPWVAKRRIKRHGVQRVRLTSASIVRVFSGLVEPLLDRRFAASRCAERNATIPGVTLTAPADKRDMIADLAVAIDQPDWPLRWAHAWDSEAENILPIAWRMLWDPMSPAPPRESGVDLRERGTWRSLYPSDGTIPELIVLGVHYLMTNRDSTAEWSMVWLRLRKAEPGNAATRLLEAIALDRVERSAIALPCASLVRQKRLDGVVRRLLLPVALNNLRMTMAKDPNAPRLWLALLSNYTRDASYYARASAWLMDSQHFDNPVWAAVWLEFERAPSAVSGMTHVALYRLALRWLKEGVLQTGWEKVFARIWESNDESRREMYALAVLWLAERGRQHAGWVKVWLELADPLAGPIPHDLLDLAVRFLSDTSMFQTALWPLCFERTALGIMSGDTHFGDNAAAYGKARLAFDRWVKIKIAAIDWLRETDHPSKWPDVWWRAVLLDESPKYRAELLRLAMPWLTLALETRRSNFDTVWIKCWDLGGDRTELRDMGERWLANTLNDPTGWMSVFERLSADSLGTEQQARLVPLARYWSTLHPEA